MDNRLIVTRDEIYKKCPSIFWEVSIFTMLVAIALAGLEALVPGLYFFTYAIIFFPILYCAFVTLYSIKFGGTISLKSTFVISRSYFKPNAFGCFDLIKSLLWAFLVNLGFSLVIGFIVEPIMTIVHGEAFTNSLEEMVATFSTSYEAIYEFFSKDSLAVTYIGICNAIAFTFGLLFFVYRIASRSPSIYIGLNMEKARASFSVRSFSFFIKNNRKEYLKDFFGLNWVLFVLFIIGEGVGYGLAAALELDVDYLLVITSVGGLLFMIPMVPYFFANAEALFNKYQDKLKNSSKDMTLDLLKRLKASGKLTPDDLAKVDELMKKEGGSDKESTAQDEKKDSGSES